MMSEITCIITMGCLVSQLYLVIPACDTTLPFTVIINSEYCMQARNAQLLLATR